MVDAAIFLKTGFEQADLLGPGCYVACEEGDRILFRGGEGVQVASKGLSAVFDHSAEGCEADS